ncbi:hypothetical protein NQ318_014269 [Aromia moschata]|uniref:THAP-type domain-containing protein n=1 Tax=Aromia moschata TaxID=1265417 RepID=A0AAV8Z1B7_9CUCU|nr:hypothetical protein NQ318_014269 [Aromia moschata]
MVRKCFVCEVPFRKGENRSFHRFPKNLERRRAWRLGIGKYNAIISINTYVCSDHFLETDFVTKPSGLKYLTDNAVPVVATTSTACNQHIVSSDTSPRIKQEIYLDDEICIQENEFLEEVFVKSELIEDEQDKCDNDSKSVLSLLPLNTQDGYENDDTSVLSSSLTTREVSRQEQVFDESSSSMSTASNVEEYTEKYTILGLGTNEAVTLDRQMNHQEDTSESISAQNRNYNLQRVKAVDEDLNESSDDEHASNDSVNDDEEFAISIDDRDDSSDADEENEDVEENCEEEDETFDLELGPASKQRRLNESSKSRCSRGRPCKNTKAPQCTYKWSEVAPDRRGSSSSGHPHFTASPKNDATNITSPVEAFRVLFNDEILDKIVVHTNEEISRVLLVTSKQSYHSEIDKIELNAYLGVCFYYAYYKENKSPVKEMWDEVFGRGVYRSIIPEKRFEFLTRVLRFDDKSTRNERRVTDKLAPIREIWEIFIRNCTNNYDPSNNCTIDEQLVPFRGKCIFRIHMGNKPDGYGLKIFTLKDSETFYTIAAIPYARRVTPGFDRSSFSSWQLENATMGSWFTSVPLFETLRRDYQIRAVGTIRKNKPEIPSGIKVKRPVNTAHFVFSDTLTLVAYAPRKSKLVFLLSSAHRTPAIHAETGKPKIVVDYDLYKGGTDTVEKKCCRFTTARRTRRWPLRFFYNMLDQAGINSSILYSLNANNPGLARNEFLKQLAFGLVEPQLRRRLQMPQLRTPLRKMISKVLKIEIPVPGSWSVLREDTRGRCAFCDRYATGRTRVKCPSCLLK